MTARRPRFADKTKVPVSRSREEIERRVTRSGATGFMSGWDSAAGTSVVAFILRGRQIKIEVPHDDDEAELRRNWRVALLLIKARLELVDSGDSTVEQEFLAWMLLPNGQTVGQLAIPAIEAGETPRLLPG